MMTPLIALVRRDLTLFFADQRSVIMSFVAPIIIATFFGYVFGGNGGKTETSRIPVMVVNDDTGDVAKQLIANLSAEKALELKTVSVDDARTAVKKGKATVAILIPKEFGNKAGAAFFRGENKPEIGMLFDPSRRMEMSMVQGILTGQIMQTVSKEVFGGKTGQVLAKDALADVEKSTGMDPSAKSVLSGLLSSVEKLNALNEKDKADGKPAMSGGLSTPYTLREEAMMSGNGVEYNSYGHSFGGMGIQFILFMGIDVGIGVLLARQRGLWKRLRAAPISRGLLLGARVLSAAMIAMLILIVIFSFARVVFGVKIEGSLLGFIGICVAFSLMTATFGLLIAAIGKTPEAARGLSVLVTLLMVMLGGAWVPSFVFPQWLQKVTVLVPTRWAMDGLDAMTWRGLGFNDAIQPIGVLLLFAAVFGVVAVWQFKWEIDG